MNLRSVFAGFFLTVLIPAAFAQGKLPPDVNRYVERRDNCDHFRGEEPYDAARREFLTKQLKAFCTGTDRQLEALKRKYRKNKAVLIRLQDYEVQIEAK